MDTVTVLFEHKNVQCVPVVYAVCNMQYAICITGSQQPSTKDALSYTLSFARCVSSLPFLNILLSSNQHTTIKY